MFLIQEAAHSLFGLYGDDSDPPPRESENAKSEKSEQKACSVPEEFLPYSCTELNPFLVERAQSRLNETEETKAKCLEEIKEFIRRDIPAFEEVDDTLHVALLRSRSFDVKRTCFAIKNIARFLDTYKDLVQRVDSELVRRLIESKLARFLPYRDSEGRALFLIRVECWNPSDLSADDIIFGSLVCLEPALENPVNQVAGFTVIIDLKNLSLQHVIAISGWLFTGVKILMKACPVHVHEIHIINTPSLFQMCWGIINPILREEIRERIMFHEPPLSESLHLRIPPCILPEELEGGLNFYESEPKPEDAAKYEKNFFTKYHKVLYT